MRQGKNGTLTGEGKTAFSSEQHIVNRSPVKATLPFHAAVGLPSKRETRSFFTLLNVHYVHDQATASLLILPLPMSSSSKNLGGHTRTFSIHRAHILPALMSHVVLLVLVLCTPSTSILTTGDRSSLGKLEAPATYARKPTVPSLPAASRYGIDQTATPPYKQTTRVAQQWEPGLDHISLRKLNNQSLVSSSVGSEGEAAYYKACPQQLR